MSFYYGDPEEDRYLDWLLAREPANRLRTGRLIFVFTIADGSILAWGCASGCADDLIQGLI